MGWKVSEPSGLTSFHLLERAEDLCTASVESSDEVLHEEEGSTTVRCTLGHDDGRGKERNVGAKSWVAHIFTIAETRLR